MSRERRGVTAHGLRRNADALDEFESMVDHLWIPRELIVWPEHLDEMDGHVITAMSIEGVPAAAGARVVLNPRSGHWPDGSISVFWKGVRLFGLDIGGSSHTNDRSRITVPTPHYQRIHPDGTEEAFRVDLAAEHIMDLETAARWLVAKSGLSWTAIWADPPTPPSPARR